MTAFLRLSDPVWTTKAFLANFRLWASVSVLDSFPIPSHSAVPAIQMLKKAGTLIHRICQDLWCKHFPPWPVFGYQHGIFLWVKILNV
jgi:hypothetical protein